MAYIEYRGREDDPHPSQTQSLCLNLLVLVHHRRTKPPQYCLLPSGIWHHSWEAGTAIHKSFPQFLDKGLRPGIRLCDYTGC